MNNSSEISSILFPEYNYRKLLEKFSTSELNKFKTSILKKFENIVWNDHTYSEWKARTYFAVKMCLSATIMLNSLHYSMERNIKVVEPYLLYYSLLNSSRAFLSLHPIESWNNGEMLKSNHSKIINCSASYTQTLNKEFSMKLKEDFLSLRDYRESFSYKFHSDGLQIFKGISNVEQVEEYCVILLEIAQYSSEMLSKMFIKKNQTYNNYKLLSEYYDKFCLVDFYDKTCVSQEDNIRIDYMKRKHNRLYSLKDSMTEGMVEDFFGSWQCGDDCDDCYNPDLNIRLLFDLP